MAGFAGHLLYTRVLAGDRMNRIFAGAGREEIRLPWNMFPFNEGPNIWTGIHDMPCVRVVLFENGSRFGFISIEMVFLEAELVAEIKRITSHISGISEDNLWVSVTHSTSMPHIFERDDDGSEDNPVRKLKGCIVSATADAAKTAAESMRPVCFGCGTGYCTVNTNRMIPTKDGWWIGCGEEFPSDHTVPVIRIDDEAGKPFIIFYNYACELSVMDKSVMRDGGRHITADLSGAASAIIEKAYNHEVTAVFLPGPSSDQGPVYKACRVTRGINGTYQTTDIRDDGWMLLQLAGERLAEQVLVTAEKIKCSKGEAETFLYCETFTFPGQKLKGLSNPLKAPMKDWESVPDEDRTRSVEVFRADDLLIVAVGGLSTATVMELKKRSPFEKTIFTESIFGRAKMLPSDGAKGMADAESYDKGTVHAKNSEFAKGSAEMMKEHILEIFQNLS